MGKQLEKLIVILGIILMGSAVFATPTSNIIPSDDTVVVTRKQTEEKTQKTEIKQAEKKKAKLPKTKTTKKITNKKTKPQYIGLKIYEINKPKPQNKTKLSNKGKCKCACNREKLSPCDAYKAKPIIAHKAPKPPKYTRVYPNRYRKYTLPKYPPSKPAKTRPIISCH